MPFFKSEYADSRKTNGHTKGFGKSLLSASYKAMLGTLIDEETRAHFKMDYGATWADLIALQVGKRAVGMINKDAVCFTAITELRETTEGKTAEKLAIGGNSELEALARAITGEPEPIPGTTPENEE